MRFAVYRRGAEAQVIRLDRVVRDRRADVPRLMLLAVAEATGCATIDRSWRPAGGPDSAVARVNLRCS